MIVMDNASFHKREDMMKAIRNHGSIVVFLPAYSPDLNPIEKNGHKLKPLGDSIVVRSMNCFLST